MRAVVILSWLLIILTFVAGVLLWPSMPERMASHWNAAGEVDGAMSRAWGLFFLPAVALVLYALLYFLPFIDPLRKNIESFRAEYELLLFAIVVFLVYIHGLTLLWNLGAQFSMLRLLAPAFGLLFFATGMLLARAKRNWFIGIRTPWTMSDDRVWNKTHALGAKLFKVSGILACIGIVLPRFAILAILVPVVLSALATTIYSYVAYRRIVLKR